MAPGYWTVESILQTEEPSPLQSLALDSAAQLSAGVVGDGKPHAIHVTKKQVLKEELEIVRREIKVAGE